MLAPQIKTLLSSTAISHIAVLILLFSSCGIKKNDPSLTVREFRLVASWNQINPADGGLVSTNDSVTLVYVNNLVIYKLPNIVEAITFEKKSEMDYSAVNTQTDKHFTFYIYEQRIQNGLKYDSLKVDRPTVFSVDSFLTKAAFKGFPFYSDKFRLYKSIKEDNHLTELFIKNKKLDPSYCDTIYYHYKQNLRTIDYTFSKTLDSTRNMKLYKVQFLYNAIVDPKSKIKVPSREFKFELKEAPNTNVSQIDSLIRRFIKDKEKLLP